MCPSGFRRVENFIWIFVNVNLFLKIRMGVGWGGGLIFSGELHIFPLQSLTMYFPNIRKPANKEAKNYRERRRDYKKVWLTEKNSGMMWNESGEDCEKQQQNHDDTLCPPSLKIHRPEQHPEASARIWRNLKLQGGFWIHVTPNSTTVLPSLWPEPVISTPKGSRSPVSGVLRTELWNQHLGLQVRAIRTSTF